MIQQSPATTMLSCLAAASGVTFILLLLMVGLLPSQWQPSDIDAAGGIRFVPIAPMPTPPDQQRAVARPVKLRHPPPQPRLELPDLAISRQATFGPMPPQARDLRFDWIGPPRRPEVPDLDPVFSIGEGLIPKAMMPPMYPPRVLSKGIEGEVVVRFTVNPSGEVVEAEIVTAEPENLFEDATLRAVRRWRFQPVLVEGRPATVTAMQTIAFSLVDDITAPPAVDAL